MSKPKRSLVFFGNERLATAVTTKTPTLRALISAGYDVVGVVSNYNESQSRNARTLEIKEVAQQNRIPIWLPQKTSEIKSQLESLNAEVGVLVAYGKIVPQSIIDIFPAGIINIHPSLLPKHRGPTPIESVILEGADKTGVSLMRLVKDMDAGPVFAQSELKLTGQEAKQELADSLLDAGLSMLIELLPDILDGNVIALPQDNSRATYDQLITKEDGVIDWQKPAQQLEREVRAYAGWPKSSAIIAGQDIIILKARVSDQTGQPGTIISAKNKLIVGCGQQALEIVELKPAGKAAMSAEAFLAGYGRRLSID